MIQSNLSAVLFFLVCVFFSSVSQTLLKKSANVKHKNIMQEYLNVYVIVGYGIFVLCALGVMLAYRKIDLSVGVVLESTGYIYVTILGAIFFKEKITKKKVLSLLVILLGVFIYTL